MLKDTREVCLMGTVITMTVFHDEAPRLLEEATQLVYLYNHRFSANDDTSELMQVNHQAGIQPVIVHPELYELIRLGKQHSLPTDSYLNIAIGPLVQTWRIGFQDATVPDKSVIQRQLALTDPAAIHLDNAAHSVYLTQKGMKIDLGAIAKGYIADRLKAYFVSEGVVSGLINLGGNVLTIGINQETGNPWQIGLQDPKHPRGALLGSVALIDTSMVTSGIYERQLTVNGRQYHHIFDRLTGYPVANDIASVTIIAHQSVDCEIWTTRLFGYTAQEAIRRIDEQAGIEGIVITRENNLLVSQALRGTA